jgi:hypothetical protein
MYRRTQGEVHLWLLTQALMDVGLRNDRKFLAQPRRLVTHRPVVDDSAKQVFATDLASGPLLLVRVLTHASVAEPTSLVGCGQPHLTKY